MTNKSFTFIELLVILAIIAILVSIMLPALDATRERARASLGVDNQRRCGKKISLAEEDLGGFIINGSIEYSWCGVLDEGKISNSLTDDFIGLGYIKATEREIVQCPKQSCGTSFYRHRGFGMPAGDYNKSRLVFADEYDSDLKIPQSFEELKNTNHIKLFLNKMTNANSTVLLTDDFRVENNGTFSGGNTNALRVPWSNQNGIGTGLVIFPHNDMANVLFGDLHVAPQTTKDYRKLYYKKNNICGKSDLGEKIADGIKFDKYFNIQSQSIELF
ncbi:hypothetical protein AAEX28_08455 [Lentisphaerota bacterium WC36G]|nr:hypothetical protein LJT99_11310 [Lentisphaerae bacterium WC36]